MNPSLSIDVDYTTKDVKVEFKLPFSSTKFCEIIIPHEALADDIITEIQIRGVRVRFKH